jgi:hypothetical protein
VLCGGQERNRPPDAAEFGAPTPVTTRDLKLLTTHDSSAFGGGAAGIKNKDVAK